jgi:hypothetical protein
LAAVDCFDELDQLNNFALELHLRCVVSALRLLRTLGSSARAHYLTFGFLERLYVSLSKWAEYHCHHSWHPFRIKSKHFVENSNNEFLLVYAKDLVAALSCDRDLTIHAVTKVAAGLPLSQVVRRPPFS